MQAQADGEFSEKEATEIARIWAELKVINGRIVSN